MTYVSPTIRARLRVGLRRPANVLGRFAHELLQRQHLLLGAVMKT
jgi:hypothetical protein